METEKQQSAVEWFSDKTWRLKVQLENKEITVGEYGVTYVELLEQAKEMEKGQHKETWDVAHQAGRFEGKGIAEENWFTFEEYWEETFKSE